MKPADVALAVLAVTIWGGAFVAIKIGLESFSPAQLTALRFLIAGLPVLFLPRPAIPWRLLLLIGLTLFTGQFLLLFFAYANGMPAGLASIMMQMQALFTVLLAALVLGDIPTRRQAIGMLAAFAGLALIGLTVGSDLRLAGLLLTLGAALSWAIGNVLVKRIPGDVPILPLMVWLSLVPPLPALALSAWLDRGHSLFGALADASLSSLGAAIYLGAVATTLAYAIWGALLRRYSTASVAPFALLAPCVGVVASAMAFAEQFGPLRYAGMALVLLGLAIITLPLNRLSLVARRRRYP
jgi:O-acetylserine/cysteine efflux transporter